MGIFYRETSTERYKKMFQVARGNLDGARQRVIGNCAGLLGPLPLIASYFTKSNGRPHSYMCTCLCMCLAPLIYCLTKILAWTIDNRRNTVAASTEKDRPPRYLGKLSGRSSSRSPDVPFINCSRMPGGTFRIIGANSVAAMKNGSSRYAKMHTESHKEDYRNLQYSFLSFIAVRETFFDRYSAKLLPLSRLLSQTDHSSRVRIVYTPRCSMI